MNNSIDKQINVWLDPCCPWAWQVANWLEEVAAQKQADVGWKVMSLALLPANQSRMNEPYMMASLTLTKLLTGVSEEYGTDLQHRLYMILGTRIHRMRHDLTAGVEVLVQEAVAEAGLPVEVARLASTDSYMGQLSASTSKALDLVGDQVGTPVVQVGKTAFFGPVISRVPKGEEAIKLFEGVLAVAAFSGFYELKRTRSEGPQIG